MSHPALHFSPGHILDGKYTIRAELARTDVSVTYSAIAAPNRELAIRVLDPALPHLPAVLEHLDHVAEATRSLASRRVVPIADVGTDPASRAAYLVSSLVETPSLAQLVALCPLAAEELPAFVIDLAQALEELHAAGIVHLGLSPNNVFVGAGQKVRLVDAGLHRVLAPDAEALAWTAPEQRGDMAAAGPAADVFAMALLVHYAATGARWRDEPEDPRSAFHEPFLRAISPRPEDRFATPRELATALLEAAQPDAPPPVFAPARASRPDPEPLPPPHLRTAKLAPAVVPPAMRTMKLAPASMPRIALPPASVGAIAIPNRPPPRPMMASAPSYAEEARRGYLLSVIFAGVAFVFVLGIVIAIALRPRTEPPLAPTAASTSTIAPATTVRAPEPGVAVTAPPHEPAAEEPKALPLSPGEGELLIVCEPVACTSVAIDGKLANETGPFALRAGKHAIGVSTPGYSGLWEQVDVTAGQQTVVRFKLNQVRGAR